MQREILKPFFDKVCNPKDWKAPIDACIREEERFRVYEAIQFFTGTQADFTAMDMPIGWLRVTSIGYRNGPAGDH